MDRSQIRKMLQQTFEDFQMTRSERSALSQIFDHLDLSAHHLALIRSEAFQIFRDQPPQPGMREKSLGWLEDVMKILSRPASEDSAPKSEAWFSPNDECARRICRMIASATRQIDICVFTITDDRVSEAIQEAHQRRVSIRIITDDDKSFDRGSDIDRLSRAGIPVRIDRSEYHMHHKFAVFDSKYVLTGSYNWTRSASEKNEENFIITSDPALLYRFEAEFEKLWNQYET
jgi:phosphatidylserine/phosphatidylglycerophosphate/cardiolipin synthase-like enzyme